jgi:hypothetical protein
MGINLTLGPRRTTDCPASILNWLGLVTEKASRARLIVRTESHRLLLTGCLVLPTLGAFCLPPRLSLCVPPATFAVLGLYISLLGAIRSPILLCWFRPRFFRWYDLRWCLLLRRRRSDRGRFRRGGGCFC